VCVSWSGAPAQKDRTLAPRVRAHARRLQRSHGGDRPDGVWTVTEQRKETMSGGARAQMERHLQNDRHGSMASTQSTAGHATARRGQTNEQASTPGSVQPRLKGRVHSMVKGLVSLPSCSRTRRRGGGEEGVSSDGGAGEAERRELVQVRWRSPGLQQLRLPASRSLARAAPASQRWRCRGPHTGSLGRPRLQDDGVGAPGVRGSSSSRRTTPTPSSSSPFFFLLLLLSCGEMGKIPKGCGGRKEAGDWMGFL
jgi:hypothetical protein